MSDNQAIMKRAEIMGGWRMVMLLLLVLSALVVSGSMIVKHMMPGAFTDEQLEDIRLAAHGLWFVSLMATVAINARIRRNPQLKGLIDDERAKTIRIKSFAIGFWVFLIVGVCTLLAALWIELDLKSALLFVLCIGGTAPVFAQALLLQQS